MAQRTDTERSDLRKLHLWQIQPVRDILVIAMVFGILYLGYVLSPLTVPMLLALALAYLFEPVMRWLTRRGRMGRPFAAGFIVIAAVLMIAIPSLVGGSFAVVQGASYLGKIWEQATLLQKVAAEPKNAAHVAALEEGGWRKLGVIIRNFELGQFERPFDAGPVDGSVPGVAAPGGEASPPTEGVGEPAEDPAAAEVPAASGEAATTGATAAAGEDEESVFDRTVVWLARWASENTGTIGRVTRQIFGTGADALQLVIKVVRSIVVFGFSLFLTLFFFFFFSSRFAAVSEALLSLIPKSNREQWLDLLGKMDRVIAAFIRGRLTIMAIMSILYVLAYWLIGVPAPLVVGVLVGVLSAVPYLPLVSVPVTIALMFLMPVGEPKAWWYILLVPVATYWVIQLTDDYIWTPLIQGKATDMDTPTILFAVLAGGLLAGFYGVLLAIPIGACFKIAFREILVPRFRAWSEGRARDFLPIASGEAGEGGRR